MTTGSHNFSINIPLVRTAQYSTAQYCAVLLLCCTVGWSCGYDVVYLYGIRGIQTHHPPSLLALFLRNNFCRSSKFISAVQEFVRACLLSYSVLHATILRKYTESVLRNNQSSFDNYIFKHGRKRKAVYIQNTYTIL